MCFLCDVSSLETSPAHGDTEATALLPRLSKTSLCVSETVPCPSVIPYISDSLHYILSFGFHWAPHQV